MPVSGPVIYVLAGVNGAGKSSVGGAMIIGRGAAFFNPDKVALRFREAEGMSAADANSAAWTLGKDLLERAISERSTYAFETTIGGGTTFASNVLIPPDEWQRFVEEKRFTKRAIVDFASEAGVSPGVVVGRLQHERRLDFKFCNDLKKTIRFTA